MTNLWFRAYKDDNPTRTNLYNYRKSDLTIQKKWLPGVSDADGIQAVYFAVQSNSGEDVEDVGRLIYEDPLQYGLTSDDVAKITVGSDEIYAIKLSPGTNGWTGDEEIVIDGLATSRPLASPVGEISEDAWPEVQYTVTEVAFTKAGETHAIADLTCPFYQSQVRKYNSGEWRNNGNTPPALQLGYKGDTKVRVSNTLAYEVTIFKTGEDMTRGLSGAYFELYGSDYYESDGETVNSDARPVQSNLVSESDGKIILGALPKGTYYLVETQAPHGYIRISKPVKIVVDPFSSLSKTDEEGSTTRTYPLYATYSYYLESGNEASFSLNYNGIAVEENTQDGIVSYSYTFTVPNMSGATLPSTGGHGTFMIYLLGLMLLGISGAGFAAKRRRMAE